MRKKLTPKYFAIFFCLTIVLFISLIEARPEGDSRQMRNVKTPGKLLPNLYVWTDTCNVYILKSGANALLIDFGDGGVLDRLEKLNIKSVDWILFTHHHREQCQGIYKIYSSQRPKIAVPEKELEFFEKPQKFRKMKVSLNDPYTVYGSSYVRPPIIPISVDKSLKDGETFVWQEYEIKCIETPGNSPGAMSYLIKTPDGSVVFSGDVILNGAKMHNWFDSEWDYGYGAGIRALQNSIRKLIQLNPTLVLPSHSTPIKNPSEQLATFQEKLAKFEQLYLRGYDVSNSSPFMDKVSKPTPIPYVAQVTQHIFKFKKENFYPNFGIILSESGKGLVVDCGLVEEKFLDAAIGGLKTNYGLKQIDAVVITHMHGDHFLEAPYLKEKYGAQIWGLDIMAPVCERPEDFDYAAPIQAYNKKGVERIKFDRLFKSGESFKWEEYKFRVDWMPGQTEFALCLNGFVDGKKVAFTGDNIFADPDNPNHTGHEAVVAHNSAIFEQGYIYAADFLKKLKPDIIVGGHSFVMANPKNLINRFRDWSYQMREMFKTLSFEEDYRYWFDPFWVRAEPYRISINPNGYRAITLVVKNFSRSKSLFIIRPRATGCIAIEPKEIILVIPRESEKRVQLNISAIGPADSEINLIGFDIIRDGKRCGELFDCIVEVRK
ncbi:MAG: MBL fold metallo-hydrolase [Verrucomicrobiia bacterium]